ncbi:MAG: MFS transporter [Dehalococcoidia bacterium]|nr:MFS transporter [Dehalococcoidia bacterium]
MMASIDGTAVVVAFPAMTEQFQANIAWIGWVFTAYSLVLGVTLPLVGRVTAVVGQKTAFVGAVTIFLVASVGCALAHTVELLVAFRAAQAIGGGAFMPLAAGILADHYVENRTRMIGLLTSFYPLGGIIGPNIGGWLTGTVGWQGIFLINVPVCLLAIGLALWLLENKPIPSAGRPPLDLVGALLIGGAMLGLMTGMTLAARSVDAWRSPLVLSLIVVGLALFGVLFWWEARVPQPIIDVDLLRIRPLAAANALSFGIAMSIFSVFGLAPLFLARAYAMNPVEIGLTITPRAIATVVVSAIAAFLIKRTGFKWPMRVGFAIVASTTAGLALRPGAFAVGGQVIPASVTLSLIFLLTGLGLGMVLPTSNSVGMDLYPDRVTAIAGLRGAFNVIGNVFGTTAGFLIIALFPTQTQGLEATFLLAASVMVGMIAIVQFLPGANRGAAPTADNATTLAEQRAA